MQRSKLHQELMGLEKDVKACKRALRDTGRPVVGSREESLLRKAREAADALSELILAIEGSN